MSWTKTTRGLATAILLTAAAGVNAAMVSLSASNDTFIRDGRSHTVNGVAAALDAFPPFVPYVQFNLSGLDIDTVSSATLRLWKVAGTRNDAITNDRYSTYGLPNLPGNTAQNWDELLDFDPLDATNGLDFRNVGLEHTLGVGNGLDLTRAISLDPQDGGVNVTETVNNTTGEIVVTGDDLVAFLNSRVDDDGYVTFMMPFEGTARGFGIASKENADPALRPALEIEFTGVVPEPATVGMCLIAAAALASRRRTR